MYCVSQTVVCVIEEDSFCLDMYDCNFEKSMCDWKTESNHWKWEISTPGDPAKGTGPDKDANGSNNGKLSITFSLFLITLLWYKHNTCNVVFLSTELGFFCVHSITQA